MSTPIGVSFSSSLPSGYKPGRYAAEQFRLITPSNPKTTALHLPRNLSL
jgi:hypothetical protein